MYRTLQGLSLAITIAIALSSCKKEKHSEGNVPVIDIATAYKEPKQHLSLSDIVDHIEYVKLETSPECLISDIVKVAFSENFIAVYARSSRIIKIFTKEGRFLNDIGSVGKGPGEYGYQINHQSIIISPNEKYIAFTNYQNKIFLYNIDGSFRNSLVLSLIDALVFDEDDLLTVYRQKLFLPDSSWLTYIEV